VTFPASGNSEDLALLLADAHEASLVVTVGFQDAAGVPRPRPVRFESVHVPHQAEARHQTGRRQGGRDAASQQGVDQRDRAAVLAALAVVVAALLVSDVGGVYLDWITTPGTRSQAGSRGSSRDFAALPHRFHRRGFLALAIGSYSFHGLERVVAVRALTRKGSWAIRFRPGGAAQRVERPPDDADSFAGAVGPKIVAGALDKRSVVL